MVCRRRIFTEANGRQFYLRSSDYGPGNDAQRVASLRRRRWLLRVCGKCEHRSGRCSGGSERAQGPWESQSSNARKRETLGCLGRALFSVWCHDGGSPVTGFKVQWKESSDDWGTPEDVSEATGAYDGDPESYTISGLTDGVEYAVRVLATNAIGYGVASSTVTATPQDSATQ